MYDECFFIFSDDKIECIRKLSEEQEAARTIGVTMEDHGEFGTNLRNDRHYIPMKITNVGKGCAINTKITIKSTIKRAVASSIPISIPVGGEVYTGLLFYVHEKLSGKYDYGIQYRRPDVSGDGAPRLSQGFLRCGTGHRRYAGTRDPAQPDDDLLRRRHRRADHKAADERRCPRYPHLYPSVPDGVHHCQEARYACGG